ncbi:synaptotagmin-11b isoform X2 [Triplophysa rosa]|uniref:Synaptotagmin XIb n=1 Tax=Triplophysa rosa TaxID=992332 RepID=A0A9W7WR70_TRIRA|nr:synaptotagmin-11b isoform X2 [Triplophysa rosa]KAI7806858.1 synaptotagmin XIb [Triplophysa rosa]
MAEITEIRAAYDMSPVMAGFIGAGVLVVTVIALIFVWTCCRKQYNRTIYKLHGIQSEQSDPLTDPPYKFIHMLKGMSIYPDTLTSSKRIIRLARQVRSHGTDEAQVNNGCPVVLVNKDSAAEGGLLGEKQMQMRLGEGASEVLRLERELSVRADYCCLESSSASSSQTSSTTVSNTATPFTPGDEPNRGDLTIAVDYNFPKKALVVTILEALGLPAVEGQTGSADPYVKMTILPEKKHRVKTRVLRKTLEPVFDETFTFYGVPYSSLSDLTLHFLVLSFDRFSRDDVIGEAMVPLAGVDPSTGRVHISQQITKRNMQCVIRGELLVSLSYQPVSHRLSVVVLKAKHLPKLDITGMSGNPYVKLNVYYGHKRIAKKKTHVKKGTLNPVFNESFIYDVPADLLPDISIEFLVMDFDRTTKNQVLGRLVLGTNSPCPSGTTHWQEVCQNPRRQISKWHTLCEY